MYIDSITLEQIQNFAKDVIEKHIDKDELDRIKKNDSNPLFKVYRIAHTGISTPTIIGEKTSRVLRWFQNAVSKVHDKLKNGIKVFVSHVKGTNSHDGRTAIGRLVGKFTETKDDMFSSMGILYIEPEFRKVYDRLNLNVGSYEGQHLIRNADSWVVSPDEIGEVSAIALSNGEIDRPAFPEAIEEGELQMFRSLQNFVNDELEKEIANTTAAEKGEPEKEENMELSIKEVQKWIKEKQFEPIDIFTKEELGNKFGIEEALKLIHKEKVKPENVFAKDEMLASLDQKEIIEYLKAKEIKPSTIFTEAELEDDKIVDKLKRGANHNSFNKAARLERDLEDAKEKLKQKDAYILKKIEADGVKAKLFDERKLSEKRKKYIDSFFEFFKPSGEKEKLNEEINKFMDDKLNEYKKQVEIGLIVDDSEIVIEETKKNANKFAESETRNPERKTVNDDGYSFEAVLAETQGEND